MGPREPTTPSPYWLAALDVFNAGDNLPCQTYGNDISSDATSADDWRVAIAWGRTLAATANAISRLPKVNVVQVAGGLATLEFPQNSVDLVHRMASAGHGTAYPYFCRCG